jgi:murein L,D-transpeptidase YafK
VLSRRAVAAVGVIVLLYAAVLGGSRVWALRPVSHQGCPAARTLVQVDTTAGVLSLCQAGAEVRSFRVAIGRSGVGKRREGGGKTPLGEYPLRAPRQSGRYHMFIPVDYPTQEQSRQGYTGSAIGVHGPHVAFSWLGHSTAWVDWTLGCMAVGTHGEIEHIAEWVKKAGANQIRIL